MDEHKKQGKEKTQGKKETKKGQDQELSPIRSS